MLVSSASSWLPVTFVLAIFVTAVDDRMLLARRAGRHGFLA
jgi:hypothetical protein